MEEARVITALRQQLVWHSWSQQSERDFLIAKDAAVCLSAALLEKEPAALLPLVMAYTWTGPRAPFVETMPTTVTSGAPVFGPRQQQLAAPPQALPQPNQEIHQFIVPPYPGRSLKLPIMSIEGANMAVEGDIAFGSNFLTRLKNSVEERLPTLLDKMAENIGNAKTFEEACKAVEPIKTDTDRLKAKYANLMLQEDQKIAQCQDGSEHEQQHVRAKQFIQEAIKKSCLESAKMCFSFIDWMKKYAASKNDNPNQQLTSLPASCHTFHAVMSYLKYFLFKEKDLKTMPLDDLRKYLSLDQHLLLAYKKEESDNSHAEKKLSAFLEALHTLGFPKNEHYQDNIASRIAERKLHPKFPRLNVVYSKEKNARVRVVCLQVCLGLELLDGESDNDATRHSFLPQAGLYYDPWSYGAAAAIAETAVGGADLVTGIENLAISGNVNGGEDGG
jgi:hypothetical protein